MTNLKNDQPVAWAIKLRDGSISPLGWSDMTKFKAAKDMLKLDDGCSFVFAYAPESIIQSSPATEEISRDRAAIADVINHMLDNCKHGIFPVPEAITKLEDMLLETRCLALGWMHAECCLQLDRGQDPRQSFISELFAHGLRDLS